MPMNRTSTSLFFLALFSAFIFSCQKSEDPIPEIDRLSLMHGEISKTWRLVRVYEDYSQDLLSDDDACHTDDLYTFRADTNMITVEWGEVSCYWPNPDQEFAGIIYTHYPESGDIFLDHGRGEVFGAESAQEFYIMKLREVSESSMLFASGTEGNYRSAILFEVLD